jgi:transposase
MDFVMPVRVSNRKHFTPDQKPAILDEYDKCLE